MTHSGLKIDERPSNPIDKFANPSSRITTNTSGLSISKILLAVNSGFVVCFNPAMNNLTPTAQSTNHFPTRNQGSTALFNTNNSTEIELTGNTKRSRITIAIYMITNINPPYGTSQQKFAKNERLAPEICSKSRPATIELT